MAWRAAFSRPFEGVKKVPLEFSPSKWTSGEVCSHLLRDSSDGLCIPRTLGVCSPTFI